MIRHENQDVMNMTNTLRPHQATATPAAAARKSKAKPPKEPEALSPEAMDDAVQKALEAVCLGGGFLLGSSGIPKIHTQHLGVLVSSITKA